MTVTAKNTHSILIEITKNGPINTQWKHSLFVTLMVCIKNIKGSKKKSSAWVSIADQYEKYFMNSTLGNLMKMESVNIMQSVFE